VALVYETPSILTILIWSSFLLFLNVVHFLLDKAIYCGLVGQIFVGVAWGTPGGNILGNDAEKIMVPLGYLGLILLVYKGDLLRFPRDGKDQVLADKYEVVSLFLFPLLNRTWSCLLRSPWPASACRLPSHSAC
jgi:hypothetical protein